MRRTVQFTICDMSYTLCTVVIIKGTLETMKKGIDNQIAICYTVNSDADGITNKSPATPECILCA